MLMGESQSANLKFAACLSFSYLIAVVRSYSYLFVAKAATFKKRFTCKTFVCDKFFVVVIFFFVVH